MASPLFVVVLACLVALSSASHYRYGTLSWTCSGNSANFTLETAWRRDYYTPLPVVGTQLQNIGSFSYGDGTGVGLNSYVTTVNTNGNWVISSVTFPHYYKTPNNNGQPFQAVFSGNARIGTLNNNANQPWYLTTTVDCNLGSSPRSKMLPIANVLLVGSSVVTFEVPAVTDDNSQLHYTLGTSMDICGTATGCSNPPGLSVDPTSGVVTWNLAGLATGLWCAVININTPTVRVPVDFIINYTQVAGVCSNGCTNPGKACYLPTDCGSCNSGCVKPQPPMFVYPTPVSNSSINMILGEEATFNITAMSPQPNYIVSIQSASLPDGAFLSTPVGSNPVTTQFTWTPDNDQLGPSIVCFSATDNYYLASPQYCITIMVTYGCMPACSDNAFCNTTGVCECIPGYSGYNCSDFGGNIPTGGSVLYGSVGMHKYNYYTFTTTSSSTAIKLIVDTVESNFDTAVFVSTSNPEPTITSNNWDSVAENPNTIVVTPSDPDFIVGTYYIGVMGWYSSFGSLIDYNITLFAQ
jgi:hypothetical protein